eukprot:8012163-Alexandrium_andersonii.AAC.1
MPQTPSGRSSCGPSPPPGNTRASQTRTRPWGGLAEKALEARAAIVARQVLRQQLAGTLDEPEHCRGAHKHLPLCPRLKLSLIHI